jgi:peptidoglycan/xylan/chitin deacetylase (PgdA/CDA1 family)
VPQRSDEPGCALFVGQHEIGIGHPGRFATLLRFIDHIAERSDVWVCGRDQIADFWRSTMSPDQAR